LPTFRQVDEYTPPVALHPTQGAVDVLKLDWHPPAQLLVSRWSLASFAASDIGAADTAAMVVDVRDPVLRLATRCAGLCGLAICLGASTVTPGSSVLTGVG